MKVLLTINCILFLAIAGFFLDRIVTDPDDSMKRGIVSSNILNYEVSDENFQIETMASDVMVLQEDKSFASQVRQPNTIYEIKYNFDLAGKKVTIPEGSVLYFLGGSLSNGVIEGQNTSIYYVSGVIYCKLSGSFSNESIHMEWFGIKSGEAFTKNNDKIMQSLVIPSMENIGNTLYMGPQTNMYYSKPIVFDGSYELDLRGHLLFAGALESIAVSVGTPNSRIYAKNYSIHSVTAANKDGFYNKGKIVESVGVCLWNLKQCNITLDEVTNFGYCIRLCGSVGGSSSNKIFFTRVGGHCYYGIHCLSYDKGWVNENTFYCKAIMNNSGNPAKDVMCAIWLEAQDKYTCNGNVFFDPCVEDCFYVLKCTNAKFNIVHDARAEKINHAITADEKSRDNIMYIKYWDRGDYSSIGSNRVVKLSEIIPPMAHVFSEQIGKSNTMHYGQCVNSDGFHAQGKVNSGYVFGKIVEIANPNDDADIEILFEQPGFFVILFLNDDYTGKTKNKNDQYILSSNIPWEKFNNGIKGKTEASRISLHLSKHSGKLFVGSFSESSYGNTISIDLYSNNLIVDELFSSEGAVFSLKKNTGIKAFYYKNSSIHFLAPFETLRLNGVLNLENKTLDLTNKTIYIEKQGRLIKGTVNISGSSIYPDFNALISGSNINVIGMPATGTMYFQKGKPTWSNGKAWVDAAGMIVN